jgi:hypothetical protein
MFDETSRYADLPTAELLLSDGRRVRYAQRRFLPQARSLPVLAEIVTTPADRLDLLAGRTVGDPEQYWRICDANDTMNPAALLSPPGRRLRIPLTDSYR